MNGMRNGMGKEITRDALGVQPQISIEQVINMLRQGMSPEELVQQGVPIELIKQAIAMVQQSSVPGGEVGLSGMQG